MSRRGSTFQLSQAYLKSILSYDAESGLFTWTKYAPRSKQPGTVAGHVGKGYRIIEIHGRSYLAHRLAWMYVHGEMPDCIDHANGDPDDNKITNLRIATPSQNSANSRKPDHNTSGAKGVRITTSGKYQAVLKCNGTTYNLGVYATKEEAAQAYLAGAQKHFGEFAHNGERQAARMKKKKVGPLSTEWIRNGGRNNTVTPLYPDQKPSTLWNCNDRALRAILAPHRYAEKLRKAEEDRKKTIQRAAESLPPHLRDKIR